MPLHLLEWCLGFLTCLRFVRIVGQANGFRLNEHSPIGQVDVSGSRLCLVRQNAFNLQAIKQKYDVFPYAVFRALGIGVQKTMDGELVHRDRALTEAPRYAS